VLTGVTAIGIVAVWRAANSILTSMLGTLKK